MTSIRTRFLAAFGLAIVALAIALFYKSATILRPPPFLELSPAIGYLGLALLATVGVAKMKEEKSALMVARTIRAANTLFAIAMVGAIFLLLPINNRGADILYVLLLNGALVSGAYFLWWLLHRELRIASKKSA